MEGPSQKASGTMQENTQSPANETLIKEMLDIIANDSENLERTMKWLTDDCVWVMEPGGTEYHGSKQIKGFVGIAISGRTHDKDHKIEILNWFTGGENLCVEYTHSAKLTGAFTAGIKGAIKAGVSRYCMIYHMREGKIDRVHEYINASSWWLNCLMPIALAYLHRLTKKKLAQAEGR
jgi:ketosteroid isomerase-like protein